jgi:hypothetical protein
MNAIILIRTDHIEQHPLRRQEIATPNSLAVDGHRYTRRRNMRRELGVGEPAPKLELPTETGEMVSLESLHGRAVLVSFLSHAA